ncbi:MAG: aminodeoxychorismate synthase component I [Terrimonas sp.]|nr:aminodeoxychorismate synthase component I [Terrimonas sp.]
MINNAAFIHRGATNTNCKFPIDDFREIKYKVLNWADRFGTFCFLDNHFYATGPHSVEILLAVDPIESISGDAGNMLAAFQQKLDAGRHWWFGHLGYDLKNETEGLSSSHPDHIGFPDFFFFRPATIIKLTADCVEIITEGDAGAIFKSIMESASEIAEQEPLDQIAIRQRMQRDEYIETVQRLQQHILRGDCYEINFCQEFYAENVKLSPLRLYIDLSAVSPNPFSAFYRIGQRFLVCASPERYLKKEGGIILSQPIKGTSARFQSDHDRDTQSRNELAASKKDRSENVMVVDLVRNDLSKICKASTVVVNELFSVYSFPQVHQMISTISGHLREDVNFKDIIHATFPMGSMTGAPKRKVMDLIEQYEKTKRGLFSGAVGYISPGFDFDFNVVIRSVLYNREDGYLAFLAGSGITFYSDAESEYEECMVKAAAIKKVLLPDPS